jgi:hypothetical protein
MSPSLKQAKWNINKPRRLSAFSKNQTLLERKQIWSQLTTLLLKLVRMLSNFNQSKAKFKNSQLKMAPANLNKSNLKNKSLLINEQLMKMCKQSSLSVKLNLLIWIFLSRRFLKLSMTTNPQKWKISPKKKLRCKMKAMMKKILQPRIRSFLLGMTT